MAIRFYARKLECITMYNNDDVFLELRVAVYQENELSDMIYE
jgi:hypothetical protein